MSSKSRVVKLGDVADVSWGDTKTTKAAYRETGFPAYSATGQDGFLDHFDYDVPGVVLSAIGAQCGKTWFAQGKWSCIKNTIRILGVSGVSETRYLYYAMQMPDFFPRRGSAQPFIAQQDARNVLLPLPQLEEQRRIAGVLGALDDLIENDLRIAAYCRELRQAIMRQALSSATAEGSLSEMATFLNGKNFTKGADGQGRPVIRTPELRSGPGANTVRSQVDADPGFIAQPGDLLFVWSGSLMVDRWIHDEGLVNQHIFKVIPKEGIPDWLVLALIEWQMPWFIGLAADKATTMGHITRAHLDAKVPLPTPDEVEALSKQIEPLWDAELELRREALQLASTRDELLPLLMSGRVRVKDVAA